MASYFSMSTKQEENESCVPQLGLKERMIAFAVCIGLGYFLQVLSFGQLFSALAGHPEKFAITYTLGNIIAISATGFLVGFKQQFSNLADENRKYTSMVFVGSMVLTLICTFLIKSVILITILLIIQILAYIWYVASYIPYGRSLIKQCVNSCCQREIIP